MIPKILALYLPIHFKKMMNGGGKVLRNGLMLVRPNHYGGDIINQKFLLI